MRILVDECCERELVAALRSAGHDVLYMLEHRPGAADREIVEPARIHGRVLVTDDKDFGDLIVRHRLPSAGIVLLRIDPLNRVKRAKALTKAIERFGEQLRRQLTVVRANVVRVRLLDP